MSVESPNVGVAFALVIGAGLATGVGASVVFFPSLVKLASRRVLAGALGLSAGVMSYVSFVEIFGKSTGSFIEGGETEERAYLYSTLCFFGGCIVMLLLDFVVHLISGRNHDHDDVDTSHTVPDKDQAKHELGAHCLACSPDPVGDLKILQHQAESIIRREEDEEREYSPDDDFPVDYESGTKTVGEVEEIEKDVEEVAPEQSANSIKQEAVAAADEKEKQKLVKMGVNTALAIGLHNFPEGLATFVAALADPSVGAVLAIAIGIHNIPEGLCVALPIYYATGNRMKAFGWALLSGASEPLAALLGWAILANAFSPHVYALLFGLVAGMMVIISIRELLPTAHRYDPEDSVVTYSFIGGMIIMALSLILFVL